VLTNQSDKQI